MSRCERCSDAERYSEREERSNCERCSERDERSSCERCSENTHVHELIGSTELSTNCSECHNHRFAVITGEAIPVCNGQDHVHEVKFGTDTYEGHDHEFCGRTGGAIWFGNKHIHYIEGTTESERGHVHRFKAVTLINDPSSEE